MTSRRACLRRLALAVLPLAAITVTSSPAEAATPTCDGLKATIVGTARADDLTGTRGHDVIVGLGGDDVIQGGGGDDVICGGPGKDGIDGGPGDDQLHGGDGADVCLGGSGSDLCDGGAPGTRANTPTDPDRCTAERRISCRAGLPRRWIAHLTGTSTFADPYGNDEVTSWDLTSVVHVESAVKGHYVYVDDPTLRHGSWRVSGEVATAAGKCPVTGSGTLGATDLSVTLVIDAPTKSYGLDWLGPGSVSDTRTCAGTSYPNTTPVDAKEQFTGVAYAPDKNGIVTAHRVFTDDNYTTESYTYTLTPAR